LGDELRILIATDSFLPQINGVSDTAATIAQMLAARGHAVEVLAPGPGPDRWGAALVHRAHSIPLPLYAHLRLSAPLTRLPELLLRDPPDAAVVLTPGPIGLSVTAAVRRPTRLVHIFTTDIPRYLHSYGLTPLHSPVLSVLRWMSRRSDVTLCPTDLVRAQLALRGHPRLDVWGRGVDTKLFNPTKSSAEMRWRLSGGEPEKPLVLYVGRLAREKGLLNLYEAARLVPDVRFVLVGDGPLRGLLERQFANVPSVFAGFLRGEPLASAYASSDIFVFPSESETFGQVVLQAMASGVAPIVVRDTAPAEFVRHGLSGLHVPPRSPAALAGAIRGLAADAGLRRSLGDEAERDAAEFSWAALVDRLVGVMRRSDAEIRTRPLTVR
jgi:glycosyltransferase involved in cell wall biosynthesis